MKEIRGLPIHLLSDKEIKGIRDWRGRVKQLIKFRANNRCELCGKEEFLGGHHIVQPSNGGSNDDSNIVICCYSCYQEHILSGEKSVDEIYMMIEENKTPFIHKSSHKKLAIKVRSCGKRRTFLTKGLVKWKMKQFLYLKNF